MMRQGILIVISGPSGAGKGTICQNLLKECPIEYSISATTRPPRTGEKQGVNYFFISKDEFETMIQKNELLEYATVYDNYYGTPRKYAQEMLANGKDVMLEIDVQGAMQIKKTFPQGVYVYILPPSIAELAVRIKKRNTDDSDVMKKRLNAAYKELDGAYNYDYVVLNDKVDAATEKVLAIIKAEKCKVDRNAALIDNIVKHGSVD